MAYLDKEYKLSKDEKFEDFLKTVGLPEDKVKLYLEFKSTSKLVKNGDTYTYYTTTHDGVKSASFKSGVEFSDTIQNIPIKTTYTVNGNTVEQVIKSEKGDALFKREYNGDELVVTITSSVWDGVAKRYYKA